MSKKRKNKEVNSRSEIEDGNEAGETAPKSKKQRKDEPKLTRQRQFSRGQKDEVTCAALFKFPCSLFFISEG
jgi:hypothetical protein